MVRRVALVLVVAVAVVHLSVGSAEARHARPARAPLPTLECGTFPAGDVRLTGDLTCTEPFTVVDEYGSVLPWDPAAWERIITIDLRGHTLDVSAIEVPCLALYRTLERCGVLGPYRIVNGTIVGNLGSVAQLERVVVHGVVYLGSTQGGLAIYDGSHITGSVIVDGFVRVGRSTTIQRNILIRSHIDQDLHQSGMSLRILDNIVVASPVEGIDIAPYGIQRDIGGIVARNLVIGANGPGIRVWGNEAHLAPMEVRDNIVWANTGNGIEARLSNHGPGSAGFGGPLTLAGNLAIGNVGSGIVVNQLDPDRSIVVDGGANRAVANATEPACTVIACG